MNRVPPSAIIMGVLVCLIVSRCMAQTLSPLPVPPSTNGPISSEGIESIGPGQIVTEPVELLPLGPVAAPPYPQRCLEFTARALEAPIYPAGDALAYLLRTSRHAPQLNLSACPIGIQPVPERPSLLFEWNEGFLADGPLPFGIETLSGAVWRPSVWVFGTFRTGIGYSDDRRGSRATDWANRLDLFGQLNLSGTERLLVGMRPLDEQRQGSRSFSVYSFRRGAGVDAVNSEVQTLFFEGEMDELFPLLDPFDAHPGDISFAVGRQPLVAQQGLLINEDRLDAVAITRNNVARWGIQNLRITGIYAWNEVNRGNNRHDPASSLYGILTEADYLKTTINLDVVFVEASNVTDGVVAFGASAIRRAVGYCNTYNVSLHAMGSFPVAAESTLAGRGELLFAQLSWEPRATNDIVYLNAFWAIDQFTSPARGTLAGGPLGQTGLLYSAASLGRYGPALSSQATPSFGGSLGYQMFFDETRQQVVLELAGRQSTDSNSASALAAGIRYQAAISRSQVFVLESFVARTESLGFSQGARFELTTKF